LRARDQLISVLFGDFPLGAVLMCSSAGRQGRGRQKAEGLGPGDLHITTVLGFNLITYMSS
jgi:hypothetical protein